MGHFPLLFWSLFHWDDFVTFCQEGIFPDKHRFAESLRVPSVLLSAEIFFRCLALLECDGVTNVCKNRALVPLPRGFSKPQKQAKLYAGRVGGMRTTCLTLPPSPFPHFFSYKVKTFHHLAYVWSKPQNNCVE